MEQGVIDCDGADSYPETGGPPGSDLALMDEQLLTPNATRRAVLTYGDDMHVSGPPQPLFCRRARPSPEQLDGRALATAVTG
jgi:hypothetical protein